MSNFAFLNEKHEYALFAFVAIEAEEEKRVAIVVMVCAKHSNCTEITSDIILTNEDI